MAVLCPKCRTENPETASFCPDCGTPLEPASGPCQPTETPSSREPGLALQTLLRGRYEIAEKLTSEPALN